MARINPRLELPAAEALLDMPARDRRHLDGLLRELRQQASKDAGIAWAQRDSSKARIWRAVATYSGHLASALRRGSTTTARRRPAAAPPPPRRATKGGSHGRR